MLQENDGCGKGGEREEGIAETRAGQAEVNRWDGGFGGWGKSKGSKEEQKRE